ncbi:hypothetical protein Tco_1401934 [Tanacetum coccineum]
MEEMLFKFIDKGKCEQEEMRAFIYEFKSTNELLCKERNNSLSELRLRKEKEEAPHKKFLENLKQLHINLPFIEALAQMPKYAKFLKGLEKSIDQSDLESCESFECNNVDDSDSGEPIRRIESVNTPYPVPHKIAKPTKVESEQLYSASANEIDEKKPELNFFPQHLEYACLHGDKSFPIIISSKLFEKEEISLLQVLEKRKGAIAWKMSDIKGISPSYCTHKILIEDDYKPVIHPKGV